MKKNIFTIVIILILIVFVTTVVILKPKYKAYKKDQIIINHLQEINNCISRNEDFNDDGYDANKKFCTDLYLFFYKYTRKKIDYNNFAEIIRYNYADRVDVEGDNKTLILHILKLYPSLKGNITGLDKPQKDQEAERK